MKTARRLWVTLHRWLGLTAGVLFVLLGLTGSLLVFDHALDEWINPNQLLTDRDGPRKPLTEVLYIAKRYYEGAPSEPISVVAPRVERGVWTVWFQSGSEKQPVFTQILIDPYTAEVKGQRVWGEYLMSWIYRLHFRLVAGQTGATIVGIAGLLMMISVVSGICLWWPLWKSGLRSAFAIRRGRRCLFDIHKTVGIIASLLLLVIAFTGVYMTFPQWLRPVINLLSAETLPPNGLKSTAAGDSIMLQPEEAIEIASAPFPNATFDHFHPPQQDHGIYEVGFRQPGEVQRSFGRTQVWIDAYDGDILAIRNPQNSTAADKFIHWQFPLHNGEAFGIIGRWIVFFTGFVPAILYVTGLVVWWRRRRSKRRQQRRLRF